MPSHRVLPRPGSIAPFLLLLASLCPAQRPDIAIVEKVSGTVGFYTLEGRPLGRVKVGSFPHEAVLSANGRYLYISDNGVLWMTEDAAGTNTISVVDVAAMKKVRTIDLGRFHRPHGIAIAGRQLLATTERPFGLIAVDPAKGRVVRDYDVKGKSPHMVMPSPAGGLAFVSNTDSDAVAAIRLASGEATLIPVAGRPQGGVFSRDGKRLYVTTTEGNQIAVIDTTTLAVVGRIATGKGPGRIALTPDGKTLVYNLQFEPAVGFADIAAGRQIAMVPVSARPMSLTLSPDGRHAYTGIQEQDKIAVISVAERKIERVIDLEKGSGPDPVIPLRRRRSQD